MGPLGLWAQVQELVPRHACVSTPGEFLRGTGQGCIGRGAGNPPLPAPGRPAHAQPLSPCSQVPASMAFVTDNNRPQPLWQPPPTACLTASGAASEVPSLLMHPWYRGAACPQHPTLCTGPSEPKQRSELREDCTTPGRVLKVHPSQCCSLPQYRTGWCCSWLRSSGVSHSGQL